ncbi:MAG: hypothetical protein IKQ71_04795 [Lachnospiraceae bacterium]|nr:hypothetical protein [Lachnospiraceae bacterium]
MKEQDVIKEEVKSFGDAMAALPKAAWTAETKGRGVNLETLMAMMYSPEASGKELSAKLDEFRHSKRLKELTSIAFKGIESKWNDVTIDGKTAEETWSEKYADITDEAQKNLMFQIELLHEIFSGESEIKAEGVLMVPQGPRDKMKYDIMKEFYSTRSSQKTNDEPESVYSEEEISEVENEEEIQVEEKKDPLTDDSFASFSEDAYDRLMQSHGTIGIPMSALAMLSVVFDNKTTGKEIAEAYAKFPALDKAADYFMKEIDGPERSEFLKEQGIDVTSTIKVDGQTLSERYGEQFKDIEDIKLKEKLTKFALMHEITNGFYLGKKGHIPEITVDTFEMKDGSFVKAEPKAVTIKKPARQVEVEPVEEVEVEPVEEVKEPEIAEPEISPEEFKANLSSRVENIVKGETVTLRSDVVLTEGTEAKWSTLKQIHSIHNELKAAAERLDEIKKSGENTKLYDDMRKALEDCVKFSDIENSEASINKLNDAMDKYQKAAAAYHKDRKGIFFGPSSDAGKVRLKEAKEAKDKVPGLMDSLKGTAGLIGEEGFAGKSLIELAGESIATARAAGSKKFSVNEFEGKFGPDYMEAAAKKYLKSEGKAITADSVADLAYDGDFIAAVEENPTSYVEKYEHFLAASEFLNDHYHRILHDETVSPENRREAEFMLNGNKFSDKAWNLAANAEFLDNYEKNGSSFIEKWETRVQAEAYLAEKNGVAPSKAEIKELANNKVFQMVAKKHPTEFGNKWDENLEKANELKEQYKKELEELTLGIDSYDNIVTFVKDNYEPTPEHAEAYETAKEALKERKAAIKEEKERVYDARQDLKEMEDSPEKDKMKEQIEKDADALEQTVATYKQDKANLVTELLLPDFLTRVAFLKATQDPRVGENICRLMATSSKQEKAVCKSILDNIKKPENAKILGDKNLKASILDGSIVEKIVPGVNKQVAGAQPDANRRHVQQKNVEAGPQMGR